VIDTETLRRKTEREKEREGKTELTVFAGNYVTPSDPLFVYEEIEQCYLA
jgi:hypothetical protein